MYIINSLVKIRSDLSLWPSFKQNLTQTFDISVTLSPTSSYISHGVMASWNAQRSDTQKGQR